MCRDGTRPALALCARLRPVRCRPARTPHRPARGALRGASGPHGAGQRPEPGGAAAGLRVHR